MRKFRVYAVRALQLRVNFFLQVANRAEVRSTPATGFRPIAWPVPAPLYMQRCRHPLRPSRSKGLDGKSGRAQAHLNPSYPTYTYRVPVDANWIRLIMSDNKDKGSAVMCELCKLDLAGTAADEQSRETLAAVGSALVRNDRVARRNRDYLDLHGVTAINLVSTPRAGKTSLLESTIPTLMCDYRVAVVASDIASDADVRRLRALDVPTIQVMTGSSRHLD